MGVVKIPLHKSWLHKRHNKKHSSYDNSPMGPDSLHDHDYDYEPPQAGCELSLLDEQLCHIPYELYDLQDLQEILSLHSWNSCLTEEERFSLSAFLPDMDQDTFSLTMKQLLGGTDLYFGNPVYTFFKRLQAGFYPPNVAVLRQGLQFLHSRNYYHSLKSYQENMRKTFVEMSRVWDQCDRKAGIRERIDIWKIQRKCKRNYMLDLNKVPVDGYLFGENVKSDSLMSHYSKKMKSGDITRPNSRAKGVLKGNSSRNVYFEKQCSRIDFSNLSEKPWSQKDVLKVIPKIPSVTMQRSPSLNSQIFQNRNVFPLPASLYFGGVGGRCELPFEHRNISVSEFHTSPNLQQPPCVLHLQDNSMRTGRHPECSIRNIKRDMNPSFDDITHLGRYKQFGNVIGSSPYIEPSISSIFTSRFISSLHRIERGPRIEAMKEEPIISYKRTPGNFIGNPEILMASSSDQMNGQIDSKVRKPEKPFGKDEVALPLTYKRRKTRTKLNSFDFGKPLITGIDLNSESPKDLNQRSGESSTNALKIKFTAWEDTNLKEDH
ncbi:hypothetical protein ACFE04_018333 [Oxalis oulophora]